MNIEYMKDQIEVDYQKFLDRSDEQGKEIQTAISKCSDKEQRILKFYYATMPDSDVVNYPFETYRDYAAHGVFLSENSPFAELIPDDIFWNYVLHYRINEEEIRPCRSYFYEQAGGSIESASMETTVIAANYWCAGEVTYQTTDDRCASAMAVYRSAIGRCGEESTFTTQVLRSLGIPARQVYAPRWAHCDDNHAWVEAWIDGTWKFLGACEPEEVLNRGWFTGAASRATLIHSRVFLPPSYQGGLRDEEIIGRQGCVTVLNQTGRYAATASLSICAVDRQGNPAAGAKVSVQIFNYAAFAEIAAGVTNERGRYNIRLGFGSVRVIVQQEGLWGEADIVIDESFNREIVLRKITSPAERSREIDCLAPADGGILIEPLSEAQQEAGRTKLIRANRHRSSKEESFSDQNQREQLAMKFTALRHQEFARRLAVQCRANFSEISGFIAAGKDSAEKELRLELLENLPHKDWRDIDADMLEEHLNAAASYQKIYPHDIFIKYLVSPRVEWEVLQPYRKAIMELLTPVEAEELRSHPETVPAFVSSRIKTADDWESPALVTTPAHCLWRGKGNQKSRDILAVALYRTLGIPARLNPLDGLIEYYRDGGFQIVGLAKGRSCSLTLQFAAGEQWSYSENWSLAYYNEAVHSWQGLGLAGAQLDQSGQLQLQLQSGTYRLTTANRLPNGNVRAAEHDFYLEATGKTLAVELRKVAPADMFVQVPLPDFTLLDEQGTVVRAIKLMKKEYCFFGWLREREEPTEHILNELYEHHQAFAGMNLQIHLILPAKPETFSSTLQRLLDTLPGIKLWYEEDDRTVETLARKMYVDPGKMPLLILTDRKGNGIYGTSGYNVGTGAMLMKLYHTLEERK